MALHITPINDLKEHEESSTCECCPKLIIENGEMIFVHNSFDGREILEEKNEKEFTGIYTRYKEKIFVGDKVESIQGTVFDVIKLEHLNGVKYALHDGQRPYDLEEYMSPNLFLIK